MVLVGDRVVRKKIIIINLYFKQKYRMDYGQD